MRPIRIKAAGIIALTTDFGLDDPYVGQMKGAILCRNPSIRLIDLCHSIPAQDVLAAADLLHASCSFFPAGTVHLAVVDPGVGSQRRILAASSENQLFVAPDNGILSQLLANGLVRSVRSLENSLLRASVVSPTFHGRDIMAPAAAMLASGFSFEKVGPPVDLASCIRLDQSQPHFLGEKLIGEVRQTDHFGNIRTSIAKADLIKLAPLGAIEVALERWRTRIAATYSDAPPGSLIALIDSSGHLEIAVSMGSAAAMTQCRPGDPVTASLLKQQDECP